MLDATLTVKGDGFCSMKVLKNMVDSQKIVSIVYLMMHGECTCI